MTENPIIETGKKIKISVEIQISVSLQVSFININYYLGFDSQEVSRIAENGIVRF